MRFQLIDKVIEWEQDRLVAIKNVTSAEEYLADHFPGFSVLPGVMMLETMVQAARLLLGGGGEPGWPDDRVELERGTPAPGAAGHTPLVLTGVKNIRYGQMVRPGQNLRVEVSIRNRSESGWEMTGIGKVGDQVAVQGRFQMAPLSLSQ